MTQAITFVAICPNYYGKGLTKGEAIEAAKQAGGKRRKAAYSIWKIGCSAGQISINDIDGSINYPKGTEAIKLQTSDLAKKGK